MWSLRLFSLFFLLCLLELTHCLSLNLTQESIELHSLFNRYNKPAVKEIKTIHGDIYKCVEFYKQPAFDNPLLKNHTYHQQILLQGQAKASNVSIEIPFKGLWATGEGCPIGTIPMRKYTKTEFIRTQKLYQKLYPTDDPTPGTFRSSVHTKNEPLTFYGTFAYVNIYNFPIEREQRTGSYTLIRAGNDQLQYGWMIDPILNGDGQTRTFVTTTIDRSKCFNLRCGDYIHTNKDIPIDSVLSRTCVRGSKNAVELGVAIIKDPQTKVWQLYGTDNLLGYWPNEVLTDLKGPAEYLEWGGESYNPPAKNLKGPGMGSGFFPQGQPKYDGYARKISKYDEYGTLYDVGSEETESYADNSLYYKIQDFGYYDGKGDYGHLALFGGPGKQD